MCRLIVFLLLSAHFIRAGEFIRPDIRDALFTHERTALLAIECERIANNIVRHAIARHSAGILRKEDASIREGRRLLALALHLHPANPAAIATGLAWLDGKEPFPLPEMETPAVFSAFLLAAASRQSAKAAPDRHPLPAFLILLAADVDPANADAVYLAERMAATHNAPQWKLLLTE